MKRLLHWRILRNCAGRFENLRPPIFSIWAQYFAERDASRGPAQQMMDFAQPLIENSDGTADGLNKAMSIAMVFWNLAITRDEDREEMMAAMMSKDADPEVRSEFHLMAQLMIARHEAMFPGLHNRR